MMSCQRHCLLLPVMKPLVLLTLDHGLGGPLLQNLPLDHLHLLGIGLNLSPTDGGLDCLQIGHGDC